MSVADLLSLWPQICRMGGQDFGEDLFQSVCVAVLERRKDSPRSPVALFRHIAKQKLIDHRRRENLRRHEPLPNDQRADKGLLLNHDPSEELERGEDHRRFQDAKSRLNLNHLEVIDSYLIGEAPEEAATRLGIPIGTFQSRLKRAKKKMENLLKVAGREHSR